MGLSAHEILLVLRARDEASRVLRGLSGTLTELDAKQAKAAGRQIAAGAALTTVGAAVAAAGAAGLVALNDLADAAIDYEQAAALTLTQTDGINASLREMKDIGRGVARDLPVVFDQVQGSLYDIFSSIDVGTADAEKILRGIGKAAVAGATDMETAGRANIAIMNAWELKADDINKVNDVMFQLVRKGVGTYGEFGSTIGRAIPSAVKASQSFEDLAGMMAFLTRNGISTAMAATSSARALDALAKPATIRKFAEFGIQITDSTTKLKPMNDALKAAEVALAKLNQQEMSTVFKSIGVETTNAKGGLRPMRDLLLETDAALTKMNEADRIKFFQSIGADAFIATGNIRPIADLMDDLKGKLEGLSDAERAAKIGELFGGSGGTQQAMRFFNLAVDDQNDLLQTLAGHMYDAGGAATEAYDIMSQTPQAKIQELTNKWEVLKTQLGDAVVPLKVGMIDALNNLLDRFDALDPRVKEFAVNLAIAGSIVTTVVGAVTALSGLFLMFKGGLALIGIQLGAIAPAFGIVTAAILAIIIVGALLIQNWDKIKAAAAVVGAAVGKAYAFIGGIFDATIGNAGGRVLNEMFDVMKKTFNDLWAVVLPSLQVAFNNLWQALKRIVASPVIQNIGLAIVAIGGIIAGIITFIGGSAVMGVIRGFFQAIVWIVNGVVGILGGIVHIIAGIATVIAGILNGDIVEVFRGFGMIILGVIQIVVSIFVGALGAIIDFVKGFVKGFLGFWSYLYDTLVGHSIVPDMVKAIIMWIAKLPIEIFKLLADLVAGALKWFADLALKGISVMARFIADLVTWFGSLPGKVINAIAGLAGSLLSTATRWGTSMYDGIVNGANALWSFVTGIPNRILSSLGNVGNILWNAGSDIINGFFNGLKAKWSAVTDWVGGLGSWIAKNKGPKQYDLGLLVPNGRWILEGLSKGLILGMPFLKDSLAVITDRIVGHSFGGIAPITPVVPAAAGAYMGAQPMSGYRGAPIEITVNTEEIDPIKHAADLGYEISRRLGL